MSAEKCLWRGGRGLICLRAVLVSGVLVCVLSARTIPPHFSASGVHSVISVDSHHDQRPRFDNRAPQWSAPPDHFLSSPPVVESTHRMSPLRRFSTFQITGCYFNRPPPFRHSVLAQA